MDFFIKKNQHINGAPSNPHHLEMLGSAGGGDGNRKKHRFLVLVGA